MVDGLQRCATSSFLGGNGIPSLWHWQPLCLLRIGLVWLVESLNWAELQNLRLALKASNWTLEGLFVILLALLIVFMALINVLHCCKPIKYLESQWKECGSSIIDAWSLLRCKIWGLLWRYSNSIAVRLCRPCLHRKCLWYLLWRLCSMMEWATT